MENEEDSEEHVCQSMERRGNPSVTEPVYSQLRKPPKVRFSQKSQLLNDQSSECFLTSIDREHSFYCTVNDCCQNFLVE